MHYRIEGGNLPVAVLQLQAGETVISESGGRAWMRGPVLTETTSYGGRKRCSAVCFRARACL